VSGSLVLVEVPGWSPAMVILDEMEKTSGVRVLQAELNDRPGVCLKLTGPLADIEAAAGAARRIAE
jgi:microcompartment protein CcmL/EutN